MLNGSNYLLHALTCVSTCGWNDTLITIIRLLRFIPCDFNFFYKTKEAKSNFYRPQRSCGQGNIFAPVCHSVHRGGGGIPQGTEAEPPWSRHPPEQTPPSGSRLWHMVYEWPQAPPQTRDTTPPSRHPPQSRHPQTRHPPGPGTPRPPGSRLRHTVNERPVRILLECILVMQMS